MTDIQKQLFELQDKGYRDFNAALIPNVDKERIIGVRIPTLRKLAKELCFTADAASFMASLPHEYYEENNLHAFLIEQIKDFEQCIRSLERFLPYVDNWATCDSMRPAVFKKHRRELLEHVDMWLRSDQTYTVRYGIGMLMCHYLDEGFSVEYPSRIADIQSEEYYVKMMIAWYFATALAKQYEAVLPFIQGRKLDKWTHNKAIQKAIESRRISEEQKSYLKTLKIR